MVPKFCTGRVCWAGEGGTVKNVENICSAARLAIIDEVLACREALHTGSDVAYRPTRIWVFSEQPETLGVRSTTRSAACRFARVAQYMKISSRSRWASSEIRYRITCQEFPEPAVYVLLPSRHPQAPSVHHVLHIRRIYLLRYLRYWHVPSPPCPRYSIPPED
jgi:hypothetical protein